MNEIWKPVVGFEGYLEVSDKGRVRSLDRTITVKGGNRTYKKPCKGKMKSMNINPQTGYYQIGVSHGKHLTVHRLVAEAFIENPEGKPTVNHKDGNKLNNCVENLEWATYAENDRHARESGLNQQGSWIRVVETGKVYSSVAECARAIGGYPANIFKCLEGKRRTVCGYHFEILDEDEYIEARKREAEEGDIKTIGGAILDAIKSIMPSNWEYGFQIDKETSQVILKFGRTMWYEEYNAAVEQK